MNALLYFPGFIIIVYFLLDESLIKSTSVLIVMIFIQIIMGWQFLLPLELFNNDVDVRRMASIIRWDYINQAFNFKRKFLYEWTVNWKFYQLKLSHQMDLLNYYCYYMFSPSWFSLSPDF